MSVHVLNEPCPLWFAVVGVRVGMNFLGVLHSVRMVWLRLGDVSGWCAEWAVPIVICCWWCEFWRRREIRFFCVPAVMAWVLGRWREIRPPHIQYINVDIHKYVCMSIVHTGRERERDTGSLFRVSNRPTNSAECYIAGFLLNAGAFRSCPQFLWETSIQFF